MANPGDEGHTRYTGVDWERLADLAEGIGKGVSPAVFIEALRRVAAALDRSERSATVLGQRIRKLNVWLLVVTVAIGLVALLQLYISRR